MSISAIISFEYDSSLKESKANNEIKIRDINNRKNTFKDEEIISFMKNNFKRIDKVSNIKKYFLNPVKIKENGDGAMFNE